MSNSENDVRERLEKTFQRYKLGNYENEDGYITITQLVAIGLVPETILNKEALLYKILQNVRSPYYEVYPSCKKVRRATIEYSFLLNVEHFVKNKKKTAIGELYEDKDLGTILKQDPTIIHRAFANYVSPMIRLERFNGEVMIVHNDAKTLVIQRLCKQLDYYFSNVNLNNDKFLVDMIKVNHGVAPINEILKFKMVLNILNGCVDDPLDIIRLAASKCNNCCLSRDGDGIKAKDTFDRLLYQLEFYFSSENYYQDAYLQELAHNDEEGWIPLMVILKFPKMSRLFAGVKDMKHFLTLLANSKSKVFEFQLEGKLIHKRSQFEQPKIQRPLEERIAELIATTLQEFDPSHEELRLEERENDGFIELETFLKMDRVKKIVGSALIDRDLVLSLLMKSGTVTISGTKVKRINTKYTFDRKWIETKESKTSITVMQYNILADILCNTQIFPYMKPIAKNWKSRLNLLWSEIHHYNPDIFCLQELQGLGKPNIKDPTDHVSQIQRLFPDYSSAYSRKISAGGIPKNGSDIGNAIFYKKNEFKLIEKMVVSYSKYFSTCKDDSTREVMMGYPQVGVLVHLSHLKTGNEILVATTHLSCNFQAPLVQILQVSALLKSVENYFDKINKKIPFILCGDFNSKPDSKLYEFMVKGGLVSMWIDSQCDKEKMILPYSLIHNIGLTSSYQSVMTNEPEFTNFTEKFVGTLDYIFCSQFTPVSCLDFPEKSAFTTETALPSSKYPSDHLLLITKLEFSEKPIWKEDILIDLNDPSPKQESEKQIYPSLNQYNAYHISEILSQSMDNVSDSINIQFMPIPTLNEQKSDIIVTPQIGPKNVEAESKTIGVYDVNTESDEETISGVTKTINVSDKLSSSL